ncbi:4'-phosphopantetheinyl transferase [Psychroflexus torquis ATCC 700755]|uniref:4'-phosphopantetheinyl transferase n=1 Tax=Psychroflexus torquis (strain ATCC 700755 / CIP 106069 / ACAM 623) TaxID=313595 RepID=K4ICN4_PSYTT|nr:4'-phosphopantetheinyl transferase superfamily protein [Psychroflexus torquis]AFU68357.1 4'-phosphopantetheinyl transferase [Psychroflexus torquis ATCC 700755]
MLKIRIVEIAKNKPFFTKELLLKNLPKRLQERAKRYLDEESSMSYSAGRLLLKRALSENGLPASLLEEIGYSEQGKPSFKDHNFSISHSNGYVVLAFSTNFSVGIDIEKKKTIDLKLFSYLFTALEWASILNAKNSLERFYWFWIRKEALLKAVGCTLKELKQLEVYEHYGTYKEKRYYFKSFDFDPDFNGIVATETQTAIAMEFIELKDLLKD